VRQPVLFAGSISDNIKNGAPNATEADVIAAAKVRRFEILNV
jgi:ABC-type multidrug transport system fused ATPase/permease subunit